MLKVTMCKQKYIPTYLPTRAYTPRLMSLRHKDEAFLHIPFPIPYILRSNSSEPALLLRLSLLLVEKEQKKRTGGLNIYFMSVCPFDTHLWHHASQFSFRLCSSIVYAKYCQAATRRTAAAFHVIEPTPSMLNKSQQDGLGSID